jgi:hypothetical protein
MQPVDAPIWRHPACALDVIHFQGAGTAVLQLGAQAVAPWLGFVPGDPLVRHFLVDMDLVLPSMLCQQEFYYRGGKHRKGWKIHGLGTDSNFPPQSCCIDTTGCYERVCVKYFYPEVLDSHPKKSCMADESLIFCLRQGGGDGPSEDLNRSFPLTEVLGHDRDADFDFKTC